MKIKTIETTYAITDCIILSHDFNSNFKPIIDLKKLLKNISISELEFLTLEEISENNYHVYEVYKVSMCGSSQYVKEKLIEICNNYYTHLNRSISGLESFEHVIEEIHSIIYEIKYFLLNNHDLDFLTENKKIYTIRSLQDKNYKEVLIDHVNLKREHKLEISNHLLIRSKLLNSLLMNIENLLEKIKHKQYSCAEINELENNEHRDILIETWIALMESGLLPHIPRNTLEMTKRRDQYFQLFDIPKFNFKAEKERMLRRKSSEPKHLTKLVDAFTKIANKTK